LTFSLQTPSQQEMATPAWREGRAEGQGDYRGMENWEEKACAQAYA